MDNPVKQGVKILVVDDEPMLRQAVKLLLEHDGEQVETAKSGEAALAALAQQTFDLIITDFSMPGMQGDELVARIRQQLPAQRIIMATAFVEEYRVFAQPTGNVDAVLLKPFSYKELHAAVAQVLTEEPNYCIPTVPPIFQQSPAQDFPLPPER